MLPLELKNQPMNQLFVSILFRDVCFVLFFAVSLELCRCSSDIFLSSRPRPGLAATYITGYG